MSPHPSDSPATPSAIAIELRRVSKLYGNFAALRELSLSLPAGASVVLLGPNGAGKSTLLKVIAGLIQPTYGETRIFGEPPLASRGHVATMGHSTMLYDELTAYENLLYLLGLHNPALTASQRREEVDLALREVSLDPANPRHLAEYSQGMRQRASLARALLSKPDILLLDEPFSNLDVASVQAMVRRLQQYLAEFPRNGRAHTLVLTTHQAELARPLAKQTLTLCDGRLISDIKHQAGLTYKPDNKETQPLSSL